MSDWRVIEPLDAADAVDCFADVGDARLHYQEVGPPGAPPLILLHGGGPGATAWNNFLYNARALSTRHRCYFVNLPHYGKSSMEPLSGPLFAGHARRIEAFMDALGIVSAHFVNQSFGSGVAIALAVHRPDRVRSLVLLGGQPILGGVVAPIAAFTKRARSIVSDYYLADGGPSLDKMHRLIADLEFRDDTRLTELNVRLRYEASLDPAMARLAATPGASGNWDSLIGDFAAVKARSLILWGAYDWFGGPDVALLMLNQFADARLHIVGDAAHHLQTEQPEEFNRVLLPFLEA